MKYGWIAVGLAMAYAGAVLLTRHFENREIDRAALEARSRREPPPPAAGNGVRIAHFYAASGRIYRGTQTLVCYGVENARAVEIEPAIEALRPLGNRCFGIAPEETTTYTLTAEGAGGARVSAGFTVEVAPPPPYIERVDVSKAKVKRGEVVVVCARLRDVVSARLEPIGWKVPNGDRACVQFRPAVTLNYKLTAMGEAGDKDQVSFKVAVE